MPLGKPHSGKLYWWKTQSVIFCYLVYLLIGVTVMTLTLSVIYSIPEFDLSSFFLMNCVSGRSGHVTNGNASGNGSRPNDPERIRLNSGGASGPMYTQQNDENLDVTNVGWIMKYIHVAFFKSTPCKSSALVKVIPCGLPLPVIKIRQYFIPIFHDIEKGWKRVYYFCLVDFLQHFTPFALIFALFSMVSFLHPFLHTFRRFSLNWILACNPWATLIPWHVDIFHDFFIISG